MPAVESSFTIRDFFERAVSARAEETALGVIRGGELHWRTWGEVAADVAALAAEIQAAGVAAGECIAQVSENRYEWIITDLALHMIGAVHVPIHVTLSGQQIAEQITDCGARLVFVSTRSLLATIVDRLPKAKVCWLHDEQAERRPSGGAQPAVAPQSPASSPQPPEALATILYTSGTTGRPRGVMLSHGNLAANAAATADAFATERCETRLCFLPLSHIFARTCDLYTWVYRGSRLVLAESRETFWRDCQLARPTALCAVPYVYRKIAEHVREHNAADEAGGLREFFGGQIELLNSGGAPLAPDVEQWYRDRDLSILPGYGLTETSPVVSLSTLEENRFGSVGRPLPNVEVQIASDGEILVRGPNIMRGYWHDETATNEAIPDGWFHTGDLGEIDNDGFLYIRGRKKELIVLATGKKVVPSRVESLLTASPLIEQAAVFGDGACGLVALIVAVARKGEGAAGRELVAAEIERCLAHAAHEEHIHHFALLDRPFSIERGEMTAKLSLCRKVIAQNFAAELKAATMNHDDTKNTTNKPTAIAT